MAVFKMGTKTVLSQTGSDNPTWGANAPTNAIIQVVQTAVTSQVTVSENTTFGDAISRSITTVAASSKIMVIPTVYFGLKYDEGYQGVARIVRDKPSADTLVDNSVSIKDSVIGHYHLSDSGSTRWQQAMSLQLLDAPAQNAGTTITYKIQACLSAGNGGEAIYLNRWALNTDVKGVSTLTLYEIAG